MHPQSRYRWLIGVAALLFCSAPARAATLSLSPEALERTLLQQLFKDPGNRYFLRGHSETGCYVFAEDPKVSFRDQRVVVHVKTHARLGTSMHGSCLGIGLNVEADVTLVPEAQGETLGFRDARIENLSESRELNLFLEPFLNHKLPQEMKLNAADLLRKALAGSQQKTGYDLQLTALKIHSMQIQNSLLVLDVDGALSVQ